MIEIFEDKKIENDKNKKFNFLLEGDNLHSLYLLEKTHKNKIDLIIKKWRSLFLDELIKNYF